MPKQPIDRVIAEREAKIKKKEESIREFDEELFMMYKDLEYFRDLKKRIMTDEWHKEFQI